MLQPKTQLQTANSSKVRSFQMAAGRIAFTLNMIMITNMLQPKTQLQTANYIPANCYFTTR